MLICARTWMSEIFPDHPTAWKSEFTAKFDIMCRAALDGPKHVPYTQVSKFPTAGRNLC